MAEGLRERQRAVVESLRFGAPRVERRPTLVPFRDDYASEPGRCLTTLCFLPASVASAVRDRIVAPLRDVAPRHYWLDTDSLHCTVKNVRVVSDPPSFGEAEIARVDAMLREVVARHEPFEIPFEQVVAFERSISIVGYPGERMVALVEDVDRGLSEIGLPDDKSYVADVVLANITICRFVARPEDELLLRLAAADRDGRFEPFAVPVERFVLLSGNAVCAPTARTVLHSYELTG